MSNPWAIGHAHERRHYPRIKTSLRLQLAPQGNALPISAETYDINCGGCYVEMNSLLPLGTKLSATLWLGEEPIKTAAIVASHHQQKGFGIRFVDMSVADLNRLNRYLHSAVCCDNQLLTSSAS
jgi:c-di-GMP-binding flagellar brake protein YcgR